MDLQIHSTVDRSCQCLARFNREILSCLPFFGRFHKILISVSLHRLFHSNLALEEWCYRYHRILFDRKHLYQPQLELITVSETLARSLQKGATVDELCDAHAFVHRKFTAQK